MYLNNSSRSWLIGTSIATCIVTSASAQTNPAWWSSGTPPVLDSTAAANNGGPANIGQAKWVANQALQALKAQSSFVGALVESDLVGPERAIATFDPPASGSATAAAQLAPLTIGQLKAIAAPFYLHLNETAPEWLANQRLINHTDATGGIYPWTPSTSDDNDGGMATIGQLKAVFALRFEQDADTDGLSDLWEDIYAHQLLALGEPTSYWGTHYSGLVAGNIDPSYDYLGDGETPVILAAAQAPGKQSVQLEGVVRTAEIFTTYVPPSSYSGYASVNGGAQTSLPPNESIVTEAYLKDYTDAVPAFNLMGHLWANTSFGINGMGLIDPDLISGAGVGMETFFFQDGNSTHELYHPIQYRYHSDIVVPHERKMFFLKQYTTVTTLATTPPSPPVFASTIAGASTEMIIPAGQRETAYLNDPPIITKSASVYSVYFHPMNIVFAHRDGHPIPGTLPPIVLPNPPPPADPPNNFKYNVQMWFQPQHQIVAGVGKGDYISWSLPLDIDWTTSQISSMQWRAHNMSGTWPDITGFTGSGGSGNGQIHWDFIDGDGLTDDLGNPWRSATYQIICTFGGTDHIVDQIEVIPPS